jgi:hypothetical protein
MVLCEYSSITVIVQVKIEASNSISELLSESPFLIWRENQPGLGKGIVGIDDEDCIEVLVKEVVRVVGHDLKISEHTHAGIGIRLQGISPAAK